MVEHSEKKPKKLNIWLPLLFSAVLVVGMILGAKLKSNSNNYTATTDIPILTRTEPGRLEELIRYIDARYVDDVDSEAMIEKAINNLLEELDPHSNYISSSQLREVNEVLEGNFEGIGVEFLIVEDTITVVAPIVGGPSDVVGIMAGDKIVTIEDSIVAGTEIESKDVISFLRGDRGSKVNVGIKRGQERELRSFTITRDEIPDHSVDVGYMIDPETGYIKVSRFSATTYTEFMEKLENLVETYGAKNLIIDLRQNPGGYLQEATNILSQLFQDKGKTLVYTEGRTVRRNDYTTSGRPFFRINDISILIDEGSASASEIMAGAIQDWDRGYIIGRRSFGKGLVQEQYNLRDGSALRLTVARYYTPSDRLIQKSYEDKKEYNGDVVRRLESGELMNSDSVFVGDTTVYRTSEGRVVYGGGGITPDVFVPLDTALLNDNYILLRQFLPEYVYRYYEQHKKGLDDYQDIAGFKKNFTLNDSDFGQFLEYVAEKGLEIAPEDVAEVDANIRLMFKARLARNIFKQEGFYSVWNENDKVVQKAVELLRKPVPLTSLEDQ